MAAGWKSGKLLSYVILFSDSCYQLGHMISSKNLSNNLHRRAITFNFFTAVKFTFGNLNIFF